MNIFDILGPVMVGPSSSHTAGAVRIGFVARKMLGAAPVRADIGLYGSFADTGAGHGTDKALIAGLLGMQPDDTRIPQSFSLAEKAGLSYAFHRAQLKDAHPNTAVIHAESSAGASIEMEACSLGGGRILIHKMGDMEVNFTGESPTLIVKNLDKPGCVAEVTRILFERSINVGSMQLHRKKKSGTAIMVIETDHGIPADSIQRLREQNGIIKVTYLDLDL